MMSILSHGFAFIIGILSVAVALSHVPEKNPAANRLLVPPTDVKYFALGYNEVFADSLWLRVVQDFDTCGKVEDKNAPPIIKDAVDHPKKRAGKCEDSWVYKMIDAITELAPPFRIAYATGGVILSVVVDDIDGASQIYNKALKQFPNDWKLEYQAGYHFLYETGDRRRAADLLLSAGKDGAPYWVPVLAARLYSKSGAALLGKSILDDFIAKNPDQADNAHLKQRMAEIERDLKSQDGPDAVGTAPSSAATSPAPTPPSPKDSTAH